MKTRFILTRIRQRIFGEKVRGDVLAEIINKEMFETYVEVGVWKGHTSKRVADSCPSLKKLFLVDPYDASLGYKKGNIYDERNQKKVSEAKKEMLSKMKDHKNVEFLFFTSEKASKKLKNKSVDIIFIDGQHTYEEVKKDISFWKDKVKEGGLLCGHDYNNRYKEHVVKAVDEAFDEKRISIYDDAVWVVRL